MWIMTAKGWRVIEIRNYTPADRNDGRYMGPLPSFECLAFIRRCEQDHLEFTNRYHID